MKAGKILLGVLSGAAAGAAVGMLFAPKKGSETRRNIADRSNDFTTGTRNRFIGIVNDVNSRFDSLKSRTRRKSKDMEPEEMEGDEKIIY